MRAQYKGHLIVDADAGAYSLDQWKPRDPTDFSVMIDFYAGEEGNDKADAFTAIICSPKSFLRAQDQKVFSGANYIFMPTFDYVELERFLTDRCAETEGRTWEAIAVQLTRLGRWEFDYRVGSSN